MQTNSLGNSDITIDAAFDNSYLKSSKNYLYSAFPADTEDTRNRPYVIQWNPNVGTECDAITVVLEQPTSPNIYDEVLPMKLVFGQLVVETSQQQQRVSFGSPGTTLESQVVWITLVARIPKFSETKADSGINVPIAICRYRRSNTDAPFDHWEFGSFTYENEVGKHAGGKRGSSVDFSDDLPSKKHHVTLEDDQFFNLFNQFEGFSSPKSPPTLVEPMYSSIGQSIPSFASMMPFSQATAISTTSPLQDYTLSQVSVTTSTPMFSGDYTSGNVSDHYPEFSASEGSSYGSSLYETNFYPPLITMFHPHQPQQQQQPLQPNYLVPPSANTTNAEMNPSTPSASSQPFAGVLTKASLRVVGDLSSMTMNWSQEEWKCHRRLVRFWRRQDEVTNEVECGFEPIELEVYREQRIQDNTQQTRMNHNNDEPLVVSCIYWEQRNDYFITSVDCIYLLEGLINVNFTVEEKNRIRRNLEGFKPSTVSKCKPECADFFKVIMGFPNPKPRNIEKDVKVFSWHVLSNALKKIIRKYTPSYSSTVPVGNK